MGEVRRVWCGRQWYGAMRVRTSEVYKCFARALIMIEIKFVKSILSSLVVKIVHVYA